MLARLVRRVGPGQARRLLRGSKSQIQQDIFAFSEIGIPDRGFFVEFGATDGVNLNNTWQMEKTLGWRGIVAEPARCWHAKLARNRGCAIEHRCVWSATGETLEFKEVSQPELSTLTCLQGQDLHAQTRGDNISYPVETLSLNDLLSSHGAPGTIDFLSIDTEGSELAILSALDHGRYRFRVIVCEHNHTPMREKIHDLLSQRGYRRRYPDLSRFDDWYVLEGGGPSGTNPGRA